MKFYASHVEDFFDGLFCPQSNWRTKLNLRLTGS